MFQYGEWAWKLIICFLEVFKNDFSEVDIAIIQGVELIFCILWIVKSDLNEVA
jgi:hypothetical protein